MKNLTYWAAAGLLIATAANAVIDPNYERPREGARLERADDSVPVYPYATYITMNQRDEAIEPTTFTLYEDTGIRCKKAPCPNTKETMFRITAINPSFHSRDVIRYEAVEILKNIPAHVRIAPRHLNVTESSMELVAPGGGGFMRRTMWDVEVLSFSQDPVLYFGSPEPVPSLPAIP